MITGKDIHAAWAYAENESIARRGFQPSVKQEWDDVSESGKAKYELMAEFLNDKINPGDDTEAELQALDRLDMYLAGDEEAQEPVDPRMLLENYEWNDTSEGVKLVYTPEEAHDASD